MNLSRAIALMIIAGIAGFALVGLGRHFFSAEARWERRRRRSNTRVATTAKRPTVRFSVRTKKTRRK